MSDWRQFISVVSPPTVDYGLLTFELETYDAMPNIAFTITASGLHTDDEVTFAREINTSLYNVLSTTFVNINDPNNPANQQPVNLIFNGAPVFSNQAYWPTFYIGQTDHILSLWSQAQFRLRIVSNNSGALVDIQQTPTFPTLCEARMLASIMGIEYEDNNESSLTDLQLMNLLRIASGQIVSLINNPIVLSNYLHEEVGNRTGSMKMRVRPMNDWDYPQVRRPFIIGITSVLVTKSPVAYQVDRQLGIINYRFTNDLIDISEPFDTNNEIKMTYRAGRLNIPTIIKEKTVQVSSSVLEDINVKQLRGGSGEVQYFDPMATLKWLITELREYKLDG